MSSKSRSSSADSTASTESNKSITCVESDTIEEITKRVAIDVKRQSAHVTGLYEWLKTIDPNAYKKEPEHWPAAVVAQYNNYKALGAALGAAHTKYMDKRKSSGRPAHYSAEDHVALASLAVKWGQAAVVAAKARKDFMVAYKTAYKFDAIKTHIQAIESQISSATNSVAEAKRHFDNAYRAAGRAVGVDGF